MSAVGVRDDDIEDARRERSGRAIWEGHRGADLEGKGLLGLPAERVMVGFVGVRAAVPEDGVAVASGAVESRGVNKRHRREPRPSVVGEVIGERREVLAGHGHEGRELVSTDDARSDWRDWQVGRGVCDFRGEPRDVTRTARDQCAAYEAIYGGPHPPKRFHVSLLDDAGSVRQSGGSCNWNMPGKLREFQEQTGTFDELRTGLRVR